MTKLCLGTVQFGMKYGVNNAIGRQPTWDESFAMIDMALESGIDTIDTARAYGEAELVVGEYFKRNPGCSNGIKIVSKLRPNVIDEDCADVYGTVRRELESSLNRLGIDVLEGYLLHTPEYVYRDDIVDALVRLRDEGMVRHIGVSIYDIKEGFAAIETGVLDYIQLPYSILDQRGVKSGFIVAAKRAGMHVAARSAFLQGLFMMERGEVPAHLADALPYLESIRSIVKKYGLELVPAILGFVANEQDIDHLVFGVEEIGQLREDIAAFNSLPICAECINELKEKIGAVDRSIIFPSLWSNGKKAE